METNEGNGVEKIIVNLHFDYYIITSNHKTMKHIYNYLMLCLLSCSVFLGCSKENNNLDDNTNPIEPVDIYTDDWFIDEGWTEVIFEYGNPCEKVGMEIDMSGNIVGIDRFSAAYYGRTQITFDFRFFSSMDHLLELTTSPTEGYTSTFLCEQSKYGVSRKYHHSWSIGPNEGHSTTTYSYYLFKIERINPTQFIVFYKEIEEWQTVNFDY